MLNIDSTIRYGKQFLRFRSRAKWLSLEHKSLKPATSSFYTYEEISVVDSLEKWICKAWYFKRKPYETPPIYLVLLMRHIGHIWLYENVLYS